MNLKIFGCLFFALLFSVSCTVTKRLYRPGYSVSFGKDGIPGRNSKVGTDKVFPETMTPQLDNTAQTQEEEAVSIQEYADSSGFSDLHPGDEALQDFEKIITPENSSPDGVKIDDSPVTADKTPDTYSPEAEPIGLIAAGLLLSAVAAFYAFTFNALFLPYLLLILLVASIALSIISIVKIRRAPEKYKLRWVSYLTLILAVLIPAAVITVFAIAIHQLGQTKIW